MGIRATAGIFPDRGNLCTLERKIRALGEEGFGIVKDDFLDDFSGVLALLHFQGALDHREGVGDAPIAGGVHPDVLHAKSLENIDGPGWGAFGLRIESHPGPETFVENERSGVFFDVVDDHAAPVDVGVLERINNESGALEFVLKVRSVNKDGAVELFRDLDVFFKNREFVFGILVEANLTDAQDIGPVDEVGNESHDLACEDRIFRFLGIDTEPAEVLDAELGGAGRFVFRELTIIVVKSLGRGAVVSGPEGGFAKGFAADLSDRLVVRGGAADHMGVGFDVSHWTASSLWAPKAN